MGESVSVWEEEGGGENGVSNSPTNPSCTVLFLRTLWDGGERHASKAVSYCAAIKIGLGTFCLA